MNKQKLLQFLFPELQIVESFKKNGFISKNKSKQSSTKIVNSVHNNSCNSQNTFDENVSQLTLDIRKIENKKVSFNGSSPLINPRETRNKLDIDFDNAILTVNKNFVGQKTTIEALINAFKRPFIRGVLKDKPKNTIVLIGSENIGKTKLVEVVVQALKQENVLRNSIISSMDLSFYPSGNEERLFLADLYKVLNEDSEIVVFTNLENGHASILKIVSELVKNGKSQLDARYALQENNLIEATGVLMRSSISEISANNKYFVLVSHLTENGISNLFDSKFMENVSDIVKFGSYSESEITEITKRILAILSDRTQKYLGNKIIYSTEFLQFCSEKYNLITGAFADPYCHLID